MSSVGSVFTGLFNKVKDKVEDYTVEKVSNPFWSTYIVVWLIRHWELWFSLLNFDSKETRLDKVKFIKEFYNQNGIFSDIGINLCWTIGVMIAVLSIKLITRSIVLFFERVLQPFIDKWIDRSLVVDKNRLLELKRKTQKLEGEKDSLEKKVRDLESTLEDVKNYDVMMIEGDGIESSMEKINKKQLEFDIDLQKSFIDAAIDLITFSNSISNRENVNTLIKLGLIQRTTYRNGKEKYNLTSFGFSCFRSYVETALLSREKEYQNVLHQQSEEIKSTSRKLFEAIEPFSILIKNNWEERFLSFYKEQNKKGDWMLEKKLDKDSINFIKELEKLELVISELNEETEQKRYKFLPICSSVKEIFNSGKLATKIIEIEDLSGIGKMNITDLIKERGISKR